MRITRSLFFVASVVVAGSIGAAAQVTNRVQPNADQKLTQPNDPQDYEALIREAFAPITDELRLTNEQKFKMVAIVTGTVIRADPLMNQLDELDMQIDEAAMADSFDEARIGQLSARQGEVMAQIIAMKARAKANMYRLLTPEQRSLFARELRTGPQAEGNVGAISNQ
jgi:Spy/CpxP family protein refolding chaperone